MPCFTCIRRDGAFCPKTNDELFNGDTCELDSSGDIQKLEIMFTMQAMLQNKLGTYPDLWDEQYIKDMTLAAIVELTEVLNETPWKPWKLQHKLDKEKYLEEMTDLMHFVINLCLVGDITAQDLFEAYIKKNKLNNKRKEEGY